MEILIERQRREINLLRQKRQRQRAHTAAPTFAPSTHYIPSAHSPPLHNEGMGSMTTSSNEGTSSFPPTMTQSLHEVTSHATRSPLNGVLDDGEADITTQSVPSTPPAFSHTNICGPSDASTTSISGNEMTVGPKGLPNGDGNVDCPASALRRGSNVMRGLQKSAKERIKNLFFFRGSTQRKSLSTKSRTTGSLRRGRGE